MVAIGVIVLGIAAYLILVAIDAWFFMLAIGIMHNDWWNFIPPMGFGTAFAISLVLSIPLFMIGAVASNK